MSLSKPLISFSVDLDCETKKRTVIVHNTIAGSLETCRDCQHVIDGIVYYGVSHGSHHNNTHRCIKSITTPIGESK